MVDLPVYNIVNQTNPKKLAVQLDWDLKLE